MSLSTFSSIISINNRFSYLYFFLLKIYSIDGGDYCYRNSSGIPGVVSLGGCYHYYRSSSGITTAARKGNRLYLLSSSQRSGALVQGFTGLLTQIEFNEKTGKLEPLDIFSLQTVPTSLSFLLKISGGTV